MDETMSELMNIKISPLVMKILVSDKCKSDGVTYLTTEEIVIQNHKSTNYKRVILLHEIIHMLLFRAGIMSPHDEHEHFIDLVAYGLLDVLYENEDLVKYLLEGKYVIDKKGE